jgi:hypothetical protein
MKCHCKCKITITQTISNKCKCGFIYCNFHKLEKNHLCVIFLKKDDEHKIIEKRKFIEENKCVGSKIIKI